MIGQEVQGVGFRRRQVAFDGAQKGETGALKPQREAAAACKQVENSGFEPPLEPADFVVGGVVDL